MTPQTQPDTPDTTDLRTVFAVADAALDRIQSDVDEAVARELAALAAEDKAK